MSDASPPSRPTSGSAGADDAGVAGARGGEACPLCGAPLTPDQDWCVNCGAAARTRLATSPNWKAPVVALAVVAAVAVAVLAAALVKLAGGSGASTAPATTTVTIPAAAAPVPSATTPRPTAPSATTGVTGSGASGASGPGAVASPVSLGPVTTLESSSVTLNGAVNPQGVPTSYQFRYGTTIRYGGRAPGVPVALGAGASVVAVNAKIAYLTPGTRYHYKLTALKRGRIVSTADASFTTPPAHSP